VGTRLLKIAMTKIKSIKAFKDENEDEEEELEEEEEDWDDDLLGEIEEEEK
jgi:hypothetical protein